MTILTGAAIIRKENIDKRNPNLNFQSNTNFN